MQERQLLSIEKIPVRLGFHELNTSECLTHSARNFFSSRGRHSMHHPLMHQIDTNPDCKALALCAERIPLALTFFHYKKNEADKKHIVLHNFIVAPYVRNHGLASLMIVILVGHVVDANTREVSVEIDFPLPDTDINFPSEVMKRLLSSRHSTFRGEELVALVELANSEIETLIPTVLNRLITKPGYSKRMARKGCSVATISEDSEFFTTASQAGWPEHVAVQAIHMGIHVDLRQKVEGFDMLLVDGKAIKHHPNLLDSLSQANPGLPLVVIDGASDLNHPGVLINVESTRLPGALATYLDPFRPERSMVKSQPLRDNLLGLPERETLIYYRNRHRGHRLFIVASGPSLSDIDPELFRKEITMTINDSLVQFPFTRYAAIMDARKLHELHRELLAVEGLFTLKGNSYGTGINLLGTDGFSEDLEQGIYSGYTTAYFTLQIAIYMGFREIYYLGLDMGNTAKQSHFFGNRSMQDRDRPEVYAKMRQSFEKIAPRIKEMGISVYNCSPASELKCFPFRHFSEVLGG